MMDDFFGWPEILVYAFGVVVIIGDMLLWT